MKSISFSPKIHNNQVLKRATMNKDNKDEEEKIVTGLQGLKYAFYFYLIILLFNYLDLQVITQVWICPRKLKNLIWNPNQSNNSLELKERLVLKRS